MEGSVDDRNSSQFWSNEFLSWSNSSTNSSDCSHARLCWLNDNIWQNIILIVALAVTFLASIFLNSACFIILILVKSLRKSVKLLLCLISVAYVIIEATLLVTDSLLMAKVMSGPYDAMSRSYCVAQGLPKTVMNNLLYYLLLVLSIERYLDTLYQIMIDKLNYKLALGIAGAFLLAGLSSVGYQMSSKQAGKEGCSCLCNVTNISWVAFAGIFILYIGGMHVIMIALFLRIQRVNQNLLAEFDLLSHNHCLNQRYEQKSRVQIAQLLFKIVLVAGFGNLVTIATMLVMKLVGPVGQASLTVTLLYHMLNAFCHGLHTICVYKYCPGFSTYVRKFIATAKYQPDVTITVSPPIDDHHVNAAKSLQLIEDMWRNKGLMKGPQIQHHQQFLSQNRAQSSGQSFSATFSGSD